MEEMNRIFYLEFCLLRSMPSFWFLLFVTLFLIPIMMSNIIINGVLDKWIQFFHAQIMTMLMALPILISLTFNEETEQFIPEVILAKLVSIKSYIIGKSLCFWLVSSIGIVGIDTCLLFVQWIREGQSHWGILPKLLGATIPTMGFHVHFVLILSLLMRRLIYVVVIVIVYQFLSIILNNPLISIWFNPDVISQYLLDDKVNLFWIGRAIDLILVFLLMRGLAALFERRFQS